MIIQRIWAFLIGTVSTIIGTLALFSIVDIPVRDAIIHIVTGLLFVSGASFQSGKHVRIFNIFLGVFYIVFGSIFSNWPHAIAGVISCIIGFLFRTRK